MLFTKLSKHVVVVVVVVLSSANVSHQKKKKGRSVNFCLSVMSVNVKVNALFVSDESDVRLS